MFGDSSKAKTQPAKLREALGVEDVDSASSDDDEEIVSKPRRPAQAEDAGTAAASAAAGRLYHFCVSLFTRRIWLYDADRRPLGVNFHMEDFRFGNPFVCSGVQIAGTLPLFSGYSLSPLSSCSAPVLFYSLRLITFTSKN